MIVRIRYAREIITVVIGIPCYFAVGIGPDLQPSLFIIGEGGFKTFFISNRQQLISFVITVLYRPVIGITDTGYIIIIIVVEGSALAILIWSICPDALK